MDTYSCPACHAPLKLALVPAAEPFHLKFTPPEGEPEAAAPAATSEPAAEEPSPRAERPDVAAAKVGAARANHEAAVLLREFIEERGGWFDPLPSPDIFDRFQSWAEEKYGYRLEHISKHRISKALVEQLGATWHKTGKGRMYLLPDDLRPASRPVSEDYPTVPVGPAPTSGPAPAGDAGLSDNVYQMRQWPPVETAQHEVSGQDQEGRCSVWLLAKGVPALQCELPEVHIDAGADHQAGNYWWDGAGEHGETASPSPVPFVDFPETTTSGEVTVTEEGVFDAAGALLPGDDAPADVAAADAVELPAGAKLYSPGPYDAPVVVPASAEEVAAPAADVIIPIVSAVPSQPGGYSVVVPPTAEEQMAQDDAYMAEAAELEANRTDAPSIETAETGGGEPAGVLPPDARRFSRALSEEQIRWPLKDIARIFDTHLAAQPGGLVRLGSLADIELRKVGATPYATAWVAHAGVVGVGVVPGLQPAEAEKEWGPVPMGLGVEMPAPSAPIEAAPASSDTAAQPAVGYWYDDRTHYAVPLDPAQKDAPFGLLEGVFAAGLPDGYVLARNGAVEVRELTDGVFVTGPAELVAGAEAPVGVDVSGEELQGLVVPDAAADALAAYRAASAGLSVPDHIVDEGDWG